jgi:hypothetical protein
MPDSALAWLADNWDVILGVLASLHLAALGIINLTPTPKDNEAYEKFYKWIEKFAGVITSKAKE